MSEAVVSYEDWKELFDENKKLENELSEMKKAFRRVYDSMTDLMSEQDIETMERLHRKHYEIMDL